MSPKTIMFMIGCIAFYFGGFTMLVVKASRSESAKS